MDTGEMIGETTGTGIEGVAAMGLPRLAGTHPYGGTVTANPTFIMIEDARENPLQEALVVDTRRHGQQHRVDGLNSTLDGVDDGTTITLAATTTHDGHTVIPRNRAPSPNDWRSGQRRTPPPSYSSHRARSPRGRYSPSPSKRSRSPRRVSPLPRRSRSRSPVRRRTPNPTRRVSRSSSRSARGPSRSRSPDKKAKPHLLPPIGAPTGPRAQLNRAPASPPYIPTRHTPPPRQREPCIPPVQPPAREIHDEVQLTASGTELDVGLKDEPMEVDSTKEEGQLASVPASPRHPPSVSTSHNMAPLPTGPSFASRNPPSAFAPPADGNRLTAQPPISRLDSSRQSTADAVKHEPRKAEIPQERPQVKKSRWDTREDGWGVNNAEASSPMNRAHGVSPQHKPTHGKSSPYTHHVKDSPSSPRPPLKQGDRPPVQDYLKPSTSSAPTPLIPVKDLGTSSATHSPRPPYPPHQPERTVSGDPSHAIRPAARHGPEATSRSYIHTRNTEKDKLPTIYGELSLEVRASHYLADVLTDG
ncbi:hypothetical protein DFP72DRAFT_327756 [Ephemerocybe angulata]|uniref:Uncharacterized protein n=1 Tax=Ephemerocybe angulata TaxID=980116 RepID=A0A8H6IIL4_9AGAR|nr:hypothetical protein DFP72DRAFT_327756 [Tulosesus angulatus]